jgi:predicted AAA+ superfamily ATPase
MDVIYRDAFSKLLTWKENPKHKPVLLRGARQVGKTTLIRQFAKRFNCFLELNLERADHNKLFQLDDVNGILDAVLLMFGKTFVPNSTLLFIDEIQENPKAIQLLRYFYEERLDIHVVAAGSLLEFALNEVPSFPVGRVEYLNLYPLNFKEFLVGIDHEVAKEKLDEIPLKPQFHEILLKLFHQYAVVGGMPEVVVDFKNNRSVASLRTYYLNIWQTYKDDVERYGKNKMAKNITRFVIDKAPFELDRIKFANFGGSNYRSREISEALHTLDMAKIIRLVYPTTNINLPILPNLNKSPRLQFLDTGLLNHVLNIQGEMIGLNDMSDFQRGKIIQHLVVQEVLSLSEYSVMPHFWVKESKDSNAEVDLVYPFRNYLIPIEIKSGKTGSLRSLHEFVNKSEHSFAVRMYAGAFNIEEAITPQGKAFWLMNLPYYLGTKLPEYLAYFLNYCKIDMP